MKHILLLIVSVVCVSIAVNAKSAIKWIESEHDFGAFKEDSGIVSCQFKGINIASEPIAIISARATCGCTTPKYSRSEIYPGDTITVSVSYNPDARPGRFSKKIYIKNSLDQEQSELVVKGVVIGSEYTLGSRYPIDCGNVRMQNNIVAIGEVIKGKAKAVFLSIYNQSTKPVSPILKNVPSYIKSSIIPSEIPSGEQASMAFHFDAFYCDKWGLVKDTVQFISDNENDKVYNIEIFANVLPDFSKLTPGEVMNAPVITLETDKVNFESVKRDGEKLSKTFYVENNGNNPLEIYRAYSLEEGIEIEISKTKIKKGKKAIITVRLSPSLFKGEILNGTINLVVNDPNNPTPKVRVVGIFE